MKSLLFLVFLLLFNGAYAMKITSTAYTEGSNIPSKYSCDGSNFNPPLQWQDVPTNARSLALIFDDPDAPRGTWTHWVLYNIPVSASDIEENVKTLPAGTVVGLNSWPKASYGGPCPPQGEHRYIFHLFALDTTINATHKLNSDELQQAMQGHVLAKTTLLGKYKKQ